MIDFPNKTWTCNSSIQRTEEAPPSICYPPIAEGKKGNLRLSSGCVYCPHKAKCWKDSNNGSGLRAFKYSNGVKYFTRVISQPNVLEIPLR